ncbi:GNAT family N-acetyltransferase [Streptomyces sp. WMMB303]|uniref:GNAT family N-acetyltransferase n=1 Tax=unclassified Streptomyces TaxID=2593676 RepID=UPI0023EBDCB8|nr:GNAT family N-acetyltransferase [Streptomyces sp. WMMB303]MDF4252682.1 GNAT family N-acetyltransferase [Streptomyces sp. WMMB303]
MAVDEQFEISDNTAEGRFEARIDGALAGVAQYLRAPGVLAVTHTEVEPAYEGRGVGGALAHHVLESAQEAGEKVAPVCPFVANYIRRHPDYQPLVYEKQQDSAGLPGTGSAPQSNSGTTEAP